MEKAVKQDAKRITINVYQDYDGDYGTEQECVSEINLESVEDDLTTSTPEDIIAEMVYQVECDLKRWMGVK